MIIMLTDAMSMMSMMMFENHHYGIIRELFPVRNLHGLDVKFGKG